MINILAVDDNANTLEIIKRNLSSSRYRVVTASSVEQATGLLQECKFDLVITDNKMPQVTGMEFIHFLKDHFSDVGIIMITGYASVDGAVKAIKRGADEYLSKPFTSAELLNVVERVIALVQNRKRANKKIDKSVWKKFGIIGESPEIEKVCSAIDRACEIDATVLIAGENGTGKELIARAIHYGHKERATSPFIAVNCPGIPETLFESELFGHVKGAFTGAAMNKEGLFSAARNGTIFLDEITEISLAMQAKLLRTLQEGEVRKVGSSTSELINARVIAATNKELELLVDEKQFREDLYFRLNVINIQIPPLRKRKEDIALLSRFFLEKYAKKYSKKVPSLSDDSIELLKEYRWPGNIRELENLIQRCVVFVDGDVIKPSDFPDKMRYSLAENTHKPIKSLKEMECDYIKYVLDFCEGNKSKAASILGIDRKTLREKVN